MRYFLILSVLILITPALIVGDFMGSFIAYACDDCTDPEPEPENIWVQKHNEARSAVGVSSILWDEELAPVAKKHANKLAQKCGGLYHSRSEYGENIASSWGYNPNYNAVEAWVDEKRWYDYDSNSCQPNQVCGHYTQVVWEDSKSLGCAVSKCKRNGTKKKYMVCNYNPPGNYIGQKPH